MSYAMELTQQPMGEAARAAADGAATRAGDPPALRTGATGYFFVVEAQGDGVFTVHFWLQQERATRRWTESGRGWFPNAFCKEDPELRAEKARQAAQPFDGSACGPEYLIFEKGAPILRVPHPDESESWAFGMLLDQDAAAAKRPAVGWFPPNCEGKDPAQCSSGALRAEWWFDGRDYGNGKDHLSLRVGDVLVPMQHSAAADGWCFGALLFENEFPTATPPELLPPKGLFGTSLGAIAWHEDPIIREKRILSRVAPSRQWRHCPALAAGRAARLLGRIKESQAEEW